MELTPRNVISGVVIGAVALIGVDRFIDYEARQAGRLAGIEARQEIENIEIADDQYNRLKELLANEDLRDLLVENLREDGIENPMDIVEALDE